MKDYKNTKIPQPVPTSEVLVMILLCTLIIGSVLILNLLPVECMS